MAALAAERRTSHSNISGPQSLILVFQNSNTLRQFVQVVRCSSQNPLGQKAPADDPVTVLEQAISNLFHKTANNHLHGSSDCCSCFSMSTSAALIDLRAVSLLLSATTPFRGDRLHSGHTLSAPCTSTLSAPDQHTIFRTTPQRRASDQSAP